MKGGTRGNGTTYRTERIGGARVMARSEDLAEVGAMMERAGSLYDFAAAHPAAEAIQGRGTLHVIPVGSGRWVVRRLSHGGALAPLTGDRFLRLGRPRPFNELVIADRLAALGIPTPVVRAAAVYPSGPLFYRGDIAREEITDARDLAACLFGPLELAAPARATVLAAAGGLLRSIHAAGLAHPDLNLRNVLIESGDAASPRAYIIDLEKCRIAVRLGRRQRERMLGRFQRSARKFEKETGGRISEAEWRAFHQAYGGAAPNGRA
ncbi:MAG: hypothetical protein GWN99_03075 [Gemmatimonadetes bacterium]|uniref:3-deoxy-D-manno-octulosonic acid kinase n=1 Tax=Candidatus Kutchimonas denitrificans TaxID=3056748 RepID=A0AAE5CD12_9BACT|nr:hypothetical protein [Gemmatimonadota bacterium]NIR74939.1 hypothetical protein [Candidatus Kutchimonas denitrificans]NIS00051.1 hypothetical protein [Gemmatimonadota bacterium]NIT65634.1 hypothetical protein [Gemmatimonadota bacterium]NIU52604.1 hypothetical protein [Gemmatimonadota bacterium]